MLVKDLPLVYNRDLQKGKVALCDAPWCADWAEGMHNAIASARTRNPMANLLLVFDWGQAIATGAGENQHNFIIVRPRGHQVQFSRPGNDAVDQRILLFDPWRELIPKVYAPLPWSTAPRRAPTRFYHNR